MIRRCEEAFDLYAVIDGVSERLAFSPVHVAAMELRQAGT